MRFSFRRNLAAIACALTVTLCGHHVLADESAVYWSGAISCTSTTDCVKTSTGSSTCMLFPAGAAPGQELYSFTRLIQGSDDAIAACWTLADSGFSIVPATLSISDPPLYSGPGSCEVISGLTAELADRADTRGLYAELKESNGSTGPASQPGLCSTAIWSGKDLLFPPCTQTSDCTTLSAGTCSASTGAVLTSEQLRKAGAYLFCESFAGGTETLLVQKRRRIPAR